jgi:hypothetical protein
MNTALRLSVLVVLFVGVWLILGRLGIDGSLRRLIVETVLLLPSGYLLHRRSRADDV